MVTSNPIPRLQEADRRKSGAGGIPIRLADGEDWLLARPIFSAQDDGLTRPRVDAPLNRLFETIAAGETVSIQDAFQIAARLLLRNYDLDEIELAELLKVAPGEECQAMVDTVVAAIFGAEDDARTYTDWVRASLLANGLYSANISASDLPNVMAILVATNRTVSASQFVDACLAADAQAHLESLV